MRENPETGTNAPACFGGLGRGALKTKGVRTLHAPREGRREVAANFAKPAAPRVRGRESMTSAVLTPSGSTLRTAMALNHPGVGSTDIRSTISA